MDVPLHGPGPLGGTVTARAALRSGTAEDHRRVDALFSRADLSQRAGYTRFLTAQAAAFLPVEAALDAAGAAAILPDWPGRRRSALLRADLAALGAPVPDAVAVPAFAGEADIWGAVYVLEGSRLGGALLRKALSPGLPSAFLGAPAAPGAWRNLLIRLDESLSGPEGTARATAAAKQVFDLFRQAGERYLERLGQ